jgi:hypothetical protein
MSNERAVAYSGLSPGILWALEISGPTQVSDSYYARWQGKDYSLGIPFGYVAPPQELSVCWDLPDEVCGIYIGQKCYLLFRYGPRRRRRRELYRLGEEAAFSDEDIAWFCAKKRSQAQASA